MKTTIQLLTLMLLASFLSGCVGKIDSLVPPITAQKLNYTRTGKFSSTTVAVEGLRHEGDKVKADKLTVHMSNAWIPNIEISAEGYERTIKPDEAAK